MVSRWPEAARYGKVQGHRMCEGVLRADTQEQGRCPARRACVPRKRVDSKKDGWSSDPVRSGEG